MIDAGGEAVLRFRRLEHPLLVREASRLDKNAARLPLVLVREEVVNLVGDDGATEDATYLLVLERQHFFGDVILGVEAVVTEVPVEGWR